MIQWSVCYTGAIGKATAHHLMHCYVVAGLFDISVDTSIIQTTPECRTLMIEMVKMHDEKRITQVHADGWMEHCCSHILSIAYVVYRLVL